MLAVSDVSQNGQQSGPSTAQSNLIASVVAQQKVIAAQRSSNNSDAGGNNLSSGKHFDDRILREKNIAQQDDAQNRTMEIAAKRQEVEARSIIEAQEASVADEKIQAAYIARHSFTDLLSVIRDPQDRVLPNEPEGLVA